LLEACATHLAIVTTAVGGNPEIVHDGKTGLLVPPADGPALQQALARLLDQPELRERVSLAAFEWVSRNASVEKLAQQYERFYRRYLAIARTGS
jgi:glycosyltransferase involved in cell wall biosynthesis